MIDNWSEKLIAEKTEGEEELIDSNNNTISDGQIVRKDQCESSDQGQVIYRAYPIRWYILLLFAALGMAQNMVSGTFNSIAPLAEKSTINLTQTDISLLANWYNIFFILGVFPYMWLIQVKGLRMPVTSGAVFVAVGSFIRCLNTNNASPMFDKAMIHLGQIFNSVASSVLWFACTKLTAVWFPPSERNFSTSIGMVLGGVTGSAISFLVGPYVVTELATEWSGGPPTPENLTLAIRYLLYGNAAVCAFLCALALIYFPSEPPSPPCYSAKSERFDFLTGLLSLARNRDAWVIFILYSISGSALSYWSQFMSMTLKDVMDPVQAGKTIEPTLIPSAADFKILDHLRLAWIRVSAPVTSLTAKWWVHHHPKIVCGAFLFVGAAFSVVFWIAAAFVPSLMTPLLVWITIIGTTIFTTACQPLWWEMCCEAVYPVPEQIVAGIFSTGTTIVGCIFFLFYSFPVLGTAWANWFLALSECVCVPVIFFFSGATRRLAVDQQALSAPKSSEINLN